MGSAMGNARRRERARRSKAHATPPPIRPPLDRREARRLYEQGLSRHEIAERTGYSYKTVVVALLEAGIRRLPPARSHGRFAGVLYSRWKDMRKKCYNPNSEIYPSVGGRGVEVCEEWRSFRAFRRWALASGFRPGLDLGRIRPDEDYSPQNCRWQTRSETVRQRVLAKAPRIRAFGQEKTLQQWAADRRCRVTVKCLRQRLLAGYDPEDAMRTRDLRKTRVEKRSRPVLRKRMVKTAPPPGFDWGALEREWRHGRTPGAVLARRHGITPAMLRNHLGHLPRPAREPRPLSRDAEALLRKIWRNRSEK